MKCSKIFTEVKVLSMLGSGCGPLVEWYQSLLIPEVRGSKPVIDKNYNKHFLLSTVLERRQ